MKKNIIFSITKRYLQANKKRTLLARISMILMVALLCCVFVGKDTVTTYMADVAGTSFGKWHFSFYSVDEEQYTSIKSLDYVKQTAISENLDYSLFPQSANASKPFWNVRRYQQPMFDWNNIEVLEGRLPESSNEVIVSIDARNDGASIALGDTVTVECFERFIQNNGDTGTYFPFLQLDLPKGETTEVPLQFPYFTPDSSFYSKHVEIHEDNGFSNTYTIVGFMAPPSFEEVDSAFYAMITLLDENDLFIPDSFNGMATIDTNKSPNIAFDLREILEQGQYKVNNAVLAFSGNSLDNGLNSIVAIAQVFFLLLIGGVSIVLIYNIFQLSYDERSTYLGMLSSIGASRRQKRSSVYYEALLHLMYALPIGFIAGLLIIYGGVTLLKPYSLDLMRLSSINASAVIPVPVRLVIRPLPVLLTLLFSILTTFFSSILPAKRVEKVGAIESIRNTKEVKKEKKIKLLNNPIHMLSNALTRYDSRKSRSILRAISGFLVILYVVAYASNQIIQTVRYKLDYETSFAVNTEEKPTKTEKEYIVNLFQIDLDFVDGILNELENTDGVRNIRYYSNSIFGAEVETSDFSEEYRTALKNIYEQYGFSMSEEDVNDFLNSMTSVNILILSNDMYDEILSSMSGTHSGIDSCMVYDRVEVSTKSLSISGQQANEYRFYEVSHALKFTPGTTATLAKYSYDEEKDEPIREDVSLTVDATPTMKDLEKWLSLREMRPTIIISFDTFLKYSFVSNTSMEIHYYSDTENQDANALADKLESLNSEDNAAYYFTRDTNESQSALKIFIGMIRIIMISFCIIVSLISLLNIYNSISSLLLERRKDTAMLKSMGMTNKQLLKTYRRELAIIIAKSLAISLPIIVILSWSISTLLMSRFGNFTIHFPYLFMSFLALAAILSIFIIQTIGFNIEIKGKNIIDEIRDSYH